MIKDKESLLRELLQTRQDLQQAQIRIAELEAAVSAPPLRTDATSLLSVHEENTQLKAVQDVDAKNLQNSQKHGTEVAAEMEHFLQAIFDASAATKAVLAPDGVIIYTNAAWRHFADTNGARSPTHYLGENYLRVCDQATGPFSAEGSQVAAGIRAVITGQQEIFSLEYPCHSLTEERWFNISVTPIDEPTPRRVVIAHYNITSRRQAEAAEYAQRRLAEALCDSLAALTSSLDVEQVMQRILEYASTVVPSQAGSIILFEQDQGRVAHLRGFTPAVEAFFQEYRFPLRSLAEDGSIANCRPYLIPDTQAWPTWLALPGTEWIRSSVSVPIAIQGKSIGLLILDSALPYHFVDADVEKLHAFARYTSLALENANRASQLEERVAVRTAELQKAKEQVEAILNNSLDAIVLVQADLSIQRTNTSFDRLFACPPDRCLGHSLLNSMVDADIERTNAIFQSVLKEKVGQQFEARLRRMDKFVFAAELSIGYITAENLVCTIRDITERKQAELALAEERNLLRTLIDALPDLIYVKDTNHRLLVCNIAAARSFGTTPAEIVGKDTSAFVPAELTSQFDVDEQQIFKTGLPLINHEERTIGSDGSLIWGSTTKVPLYNLNGEFIGMVGITRDISEQKARERQLRYYASLQENVSDAVIVTDMNFRIRSWNAAAAHIYGWLTEEVIGKSVNDILQPVYTVPEEGERRVQNLLTLGHWYGESLHRHKAGTPLHILSSLTLLKDEQATPYGVVSINRDITGERQAQVALEENRRLAQRIAETAPNSIYIYDVQSGSNRYVNHSLFLRLGYSPLDIAELNTTHRTQLMHSDDAHRLPDHIAQIIAARDGEVFTYEYRLRAHDGAWRWFLSHSTVFQRDGAGMVTQILAITSEITERKLAEVALQKSMAEIHDLYNNAPCGYHSLDRDGIVVQINDTELHWLGYSRAEVVGVLPFADLMPPADKERFHHSFPRFMEQGWVKDLQFEIARKDGSIMTILLSAVAIYDEAGRYLMSRTTVYDITELKRAQEAIQASEARYRLLAENISDLILRYNADGEITYASPSSQALLGYTPQELLGRSGFEFVHPDDLLAMQQLYSQVLVDPIPSVFVTCRLHHAQGHYLWMEFAARLFRNEPGNLLEIIASARNITERKAAQEALHLKVEEDREFQNALKALHEITIELTQIDGLDDFYRRAVELGIERLGFERLGLLLHDAEQGLALGTYGTDAQGRVVAEPHLRLATAEYGGILQRLLESSERFYFNGQAQLYGDHVSLGIGWNAVTVLWNGQQSLGWLSADNGIHHKPYSKQLLEILLLYSLTLGTLLARKQAENALRESEEKFRRLVEVAPVAIVISDKKGQITLVNNQAEALFGYTRTELLTQLVDIFVPEYARSLHTNNRAAYMANPHVRRMGSGLDLLARRKDGSELPVEIELSYVQTQSGLMVMSFIVDITERRQAEIAMREQRDFLQRVIDSVPDLIVVKDRDGRFQLVSKRTANIYGVDGATMLGKTDADVHSTQAEVVRFAQQDREALDSGQPIFVPEETIGGRYYQTNVIPLQNHAGQFDRLLVVSSDITNRKRAEDTLQQALQQEKELSELKSRFVSMASHEFRTPLATIMVLTETLLAYRPRLSDAQINQRLEKIQEQLGHLSNIMEDVLQLARLQARRAEFNPTLLNLNTLILSVIEEFQSLPTVTQRLVYHSSLHLELVKVDSKLMRQIIINLLSNAIKYSPAGKDITITLASNPEEISFTVQDEGIGIPEADLQYLFEPFHRATNVGTISGTGLGLTITKESVDLHGGTITVESRLGVGTTVTVHIPVEI